MVIRLGWVGIDGIVAESLRGDAITEAGVRSVWPTSFFDCLDEGSGDVPTWSLRGSRPSEPQDQRPLDQPRLGQRAAISPGGARPKNWAWGPWHVDR